MQSEVKGDIDLFCASLVHPLSWVGTWSRLQNV
jgi:hypothetical protein